MKYVTMSGHTVWFDDTRISLEEFSSRVEYDENYVKYLHRTDGPAAIWVDGTKVWYVNGKIHREDGPAIEYAKGTYRWYLYNNPFLFKEWLRLTPISKKKKLELKLKYS